MDSTSTGPHQQPTARRSAAAPAVLLALALLLALGGCADPAPQAAQPSASASAPSSSSRDGASGGDLCAQLPLEDLNALLDLAGDPLASTAPAADDDDGGSSCLLTGKDPAHAYVVTVHDAPFDDVLAGRPSLDTTAGPRSAWVDADRELVQQLGERTLTVAAAQGSDVQLSEALVVAEAVTKTLP